MGFMSVKIAEVIFSIQILKWKSFSTPENDLVPFILALKYTPVPSSVFEFQVTMNHL